MNQIATPHAGSQTNGATGAPWQTQLDADGALEAASHVVEAIFDILAEAKDRLRQSSH